MRIKKIIAMTKLGELVVYRLFKLRRRERVN